MSDWRHIVWDWNGTILDDLLVTIHVTNKVIGDYGLSELDVNTYRSIFGFPLTDYYQKIGIDFESVSFAELTDRWIPIYEKDSTTCIIHKGILGLIEKLKRQNSNQSILSAYESDKLYRVVKKYGLSNYFTDIRGLPNDLGDGKIELGERSISSWEKKISRSSTVYIGDTVHDADVAEAMQVECILVSYGHQNRERLTATGCKVVDSVEELSRVLIN